jgi:hypothetical protein
MSYFLNAIWISKFNPDVSVNSPNQSPISAVALSNVIFNISNQAVVPTTTAYIQSSVNMPLNALDERGVNTLDVNSLNQVDPFYPAGNSPLDSDKLYKIIVYNIHFQHRTM